MAVGVVQRVGQLGDEFGFVRVSPDLAVEIHDSSEQDMSRKVQQYLKAWVRSVWVVDPEKQTPNIGQPGSL